MRYFLVYDLGTKVECEDKDSIPSALDYDDWNDLIEDNGGVMPDISEITEEEYEFDDGYDVI